ncbi:MAG: M28 family peptidase [Candidatus Eisenbacteria bacterium]
MPETKPVRVCLAAALALAVAAGCSGEVWSRVDGARAQARIERQIAFGPRIPGTPAHAAFRSWLGGELTRLGARIEDQTFVDTTLGRPLQLTNVRARWSAAPGGRTDRRIVLCAHYDSRAFADQDPDPARRADPVPGANDGASGVAVLLEVAEVMARKAPACEVELAFFDGEDQGRAERGDEFSLGAKGYAARLGTDKPVAAFLFDMVGDRDLDIHVERTSRERASNLVDLVLEAARVTGAKGFHPDTRWQLVDDHLPLLDAGVPTVDIIDFDYPVWHTVADLPGRTSAGSLAEVSRVAVWLVYDSPLARGH